MEKGMSELERAADFIVEKCGKEGIVVHRYDAKTSRSIYLKFDFGLAASLRISDHRGIEKYHYKFNLILGQDRIVTVRYQNRTYCRYYPFREIWACLHDIFMARKEAVEKLGGMENYLAEMEKIRQKIERLPEEKLYPFWKHGRRVI